MARLDPRGSPTNPPRDHAVPGFAPYSVCPMQEPHSSSSISASPISIVPLGVAVSILHQSRSCLCRPSSSPISSSQFSQFWLDLLDAEHIGTLRVLSVQFPLTSEPRLLTRDLDPAELCTLLSGQVIGIHSEVRVSGIVFHCWY